jgi:ribosome-binding protein aMBF1 (putative translation factor)
MRKTIFMMAVMAIAVTGASLTSCKSAAQKNARAENKVIDAKQDLKVAKAEVVEQRKVNAEEWNAFKTESEMQIDENEVRIAELKAALNAPGAAQDYEYEKKINILEASNQDLESRMLNYENDQGRDWDTFKREFNNDMNNLGQAFKSLVVKNEE